MNEKRFKKIRLLNGETFEARCEISNKAGWDIEDISAKNLDLIYYERCGDLGMYPTKHLLIKKSAVAYIENVITRGRFEE